MSKVDDLIRTLTEKKRNTACCGKGGLLKSLESLGFSHTGGKSDNHKVFTHKRLSELTDSEYKTHSIDCGHNPSKEMKFPYVLQVVKLLKKYKAEIDLYLKE
jgi:hypothetical protein